MASFRQRLTIQGMSLLAMAMSATATPPVVAGAASQPTTASERFIPVVYCPRTDAPPKLDGVLDDACWRAAGVLTDFMSDRREILATQVTEARILHDDEWIYLAIRCREADMDHTVHKVHRMWEDEDSLEIFVDAKRGDNQFAHYGINTVGENDLPRPKDQPADTVAKVVSSGDAWTVEARIRIKALVGSPPAAGDAWGLNIARNRHRTNANEYSSWARIQGNYEKPDLFGLLVFCDSLPDTRAASVHLGNRFEGDNVAVIRLDGRPDQPIGVTIGAGEVQQEQRARVDHDGTCTIGVPYHLAAEVETLQIRMTAGDQSVLNGFCRVAGMKRPTWAEFVPDLGLFVLTVEQEVVAQAEPFAANLRSTLIGSSPSALSVAWQLSRQDDPPIDIRSADGRFELDSSIADGPAVLTARLTDAGGKEIVALRRDVTVAGHALAQWQRQAADLQKRLDKLNPATLSPELQLYAGKARIKLERLSGFLKARDLRQAELATEEIAHHVDCLEKGQPPVWGHHECVYTSAIDKTEQPYAVVVPKDYDPKGTDRRPVMIWLHCYWGDGAWSRGNLQIYMEPMELAAIKAGFLLVHPYGRGSQGYRFDGETDFRDVWKAVNDRWRIDPERVYLAGFSMGGSGTGNFCAAWPDMFAAGACYSGGMPAALAENVRHIPMRFELGGQESGASRIAKLAEAVRGGEGRTAETIFAAHPSEGHTQDYIDFDALLDWFGRYRRVVDPAIVTFTAGDLKHASSYWVTIDRFEEYDKNARVDARLSGATLTLKTTNVAALTVRPPSRRLEPGKPLRVVLNGLTVRTALPDQAGAIQLVCATQPATAPAGIAKTRTLCGPIQDAFSGPLMLVVADSSPGLAKDAKVISDRWANWHHGQLSAVAEAEVDETVLANSSVILVGRWTPEGLMGKVSRSAPVAIDDKAITVSGKTRTGSDMGIIFVQPSPLNPQRYVVVITGQSDAGVLAACRMFEQEKYGGDYTLTGDGPRGAFDGYWR